MPVTTTTPPGASSQVERWSVRLAAGNEVSAQAVFTSSVSLNLTFEPQAASVGTYYTLQGEDEVQVSGGRPIQPRTSRDIHLPDTIAHGVLLLGGAFDAVPDFDPAISRVLTDDVYAKTEPPFTTTIWYPAGLGTINRFLSIDGQLHERLVVVPGQFRATGTGGSGQTVGTERLYTGLQFEVYHAPFDATDFIAPSIAQVSADVAGQGVTFNVLATDDRESISRVVVLYRSTTRNVWSKAELTYNPATQTATGSVSGLSGQIEYFVQAVDSTGNVALALDHGNPFALVTTTSLYLPLIRR